jgi:hypothetical protein
VTEPRLYTQVKRSRETLRVGDTVEIAEHVYRVVAVDATTPIKADQAADVDPERGDVILNYELEYVRPAAGGAVPRPAAKPARKPTAR